VIVDTNNPAELPEGDQRRRHPAIIDHHKLVGGLKTKGRSTSPSARSPAPPRSCTT
jgi:hypothetical protein